MKKTVSWLLVAITSLLIAKTQANTVPVKNVFGQIPKNIVASFVPLAEYSKSSFNDFGQLKFNLAKCPPVPSLEEPYCPPPPGGTTFVVRVSPLMPDIYKYLLSNRKPTFDKELVLPANSFNGKVVLNKVLILDLKGVPNNMLKILNANKVMVSPAQKGKKPNEIWYKLTLK